MRTSDAGRLEDLRASDYPLVECTCGHTQLLPKSMLRRYACSPMTASWTSLADAQSAV
jgi:hypothetical protein